MNKIRLFVIDDHAIMRMGLVALLNTRSELEVVGEAGNGPSGIKQSLKLRPDIIIMDLMMPNMDGVETTRLLIEKWPEAKVLILTTFGSADGIAHALKSGARGAVMKSAEFDDLLYAITEIVAGRTFVSPEIEQIISKDPPVPELSARQSDILHSVTRGLTNEDIAKQLNISLQMVKEHLRALFDKIGAANRTEAVAIALRKHLLKI